MAEPTLAEKIAKTQARIKDIKINKSDKVAIASIEYRYEDEIWHTPIRIRLDQGKIKWKDFLEKVSQYARESFEIDKPLTDLIDKKGIWFNLKEVKILG
jgi:hypothetical protein